MENFTFNGVNSDTLGLIIKEMPPIVRAAKNIESINVNGRNGNLHIDNGTYKTYPITINCIIKENANIDLIKSTLQGTAQLVLSTVPNRTFTATICNQIDFKKYLRVLREFPLQLEIEPFSYGNINSIDYTTNAILVISGNVETAPVITIYGTGTVTINNTPIEVLESGITIDCDLMECVKNNLNMNANVILSVFPTLIPGNNSIVLGTGITKVTIAYRERWL